MDAREETLGLLSKIWYKLQSLPDASPVELGTFFVLLTFILVILTITIVTCVSCCCCCCHRETRMKGSNI